MPLLRALWSLLDGIWGVLKSSGGVLEHTETAFVGGSRFEQSNIEVDRDPKQKRDLVGPGLDTRERQPLSKNTKTSCGKR